jgi:hypothetical protein
MGNRKKMCRELQSRGGKLFKLKAGKCPYMPSFSHATAIAATGALCSFFVSMDVFTTRKKDGSNRRSIGGRIQMIVVGLDEGWSAAAETISKSNSKGWSQLLSARLSVRGDRFVTMMQVRVKIVIVCVIEMAMWMYTMQARELMII